MVPLAVLVVVVGMLREASCWPLSTTTMTMTSTTRRTQSRSGSSSNINGRKTMMMVMRRRRRRGRGVTLPEAAVAAFATFESGSSPVIGLRPSKPHCAGHWSGPPPYPNWPGQEAMFTRAGSKRDGEGKAPTKKQGHRLL
jgi:hypothetical protein